MPAHNEQGYNQQERKIRFYELYLLQIGDGAISPSPPSFQGRSIIVICLLFFNLGKLYSTLTFLILDIKPGLDVVVRDSQGKIVATDSLGISDKSSTLSMLSCQLVFEVSPIPFSDFYEISVGRRGTQVYSHSDLESQDWHIDLTLGR